MMAGRAIVGIVRTLGCSIRRCLDLVTNSVKNVNDLPICE
jgi:hypothetical protein